MQAAQLTREPDNPVNNDSVREASKKMLAQTATQTKQMAVFGAAPHHT